MSKNNYFWLISSYPKSGNTWCRIFISEVLRSLKLHDFNSSNFQGDFQLKINTGTILSSRELLDDEIGISSSDLHHEEIDLLRSESNIQHLDQKKEVFYKVHDSFTNPISGNKPFVKLNYCKGIVYIIRHPADIAISLKYFQGWDLDQTISFMLDKESYLCKSKKNCHSQVRQYLGSWDMHVKGWTTQKIKPLLVVRYEDMISKPIDVFTAITKFLNLEVNKNVLKSCIQNTSFKNLKALEIKHGFDENPNYNDKKYFFRKGKQGEGKKLLTNCQYKLIENSFNFTLKKYFYY